MEKYFITREIAIDAGHRLPKHQGKCSNMHGHRYRIQAVCQGELYDKGSSDGMLLDFEFLKNAMMQQIDETCDHAFILSAKDDYLMNLLFNDSQRNDVTNAVAKNACWSGSNTQDMKLYVIDFMPTAENLAKHWFGLIKDIVKEKTNNQASLAKIIVWETPNCSAEYSA